MSRPEHLSVPNTSEGIRRINEEQEYYDSDPSRYEAEERAAKEQYEQEQYQLREEEQRWREEQ